ncbi:unnamed protein product [Linum trigynum]|uniref:Uncharacterized protein n=1 Tax=Linum trigynum TaxID=586398 RepID=A0AAV2D0T4_9ROSI
MYLLSFKPSFASTELHRKLYSTTDYQTLIRVLQSQPQDHIELLSEVETRIEGKRKQRRKKFTERRLLCQSQPSKKPEARSVKLTLKAERALPCGAVKETVTALSLASISIEIATAVAISPPSSSIGRESGHLGFEVGRKQRRERTETLRSLALSRLGIFFFLGERLGIF